MRTLIVDNHDESVPNFLVSVSEKLDYGKVTRTSEICRVICRQEQIRSTLIKLAKKYRTRKVMNCCEVNTGVVLLPNGDIKW